ncbi:protein LSM14 homolog B [Nilaparvata lugens]|uniref:protein LSM14 homolog B n=1 Tax=Nilaparvata lugens TaxID=108931 RepID=UPI00193D4B61|nr:protein LSM14 homolog B [Nilaparvata lugens]
MSEMPEIGSKISLISKADIRYEGNLFTVNPTECTIALANVRSFGTEDREVENVVPAHSGTYEFIMFRGSDIKDIKVVSNQMPMNDPAIVDYTGGPSSMKAPGYHHQPPSQLHHDSYNPMTSSAFPQAGGLYNPMAGMGRTIMKPQQLQQQSELIQLQQQQQQQQQLHQQQQHLVAQQLQSPLQPQPPPPVQQQPPKEPEPSGAILDLISGGGGSRSSTPGLLSGSSRKSPTIDQGIQVTGHHKGGVLRRTAAPQGRQQTRQQPTGWLQLNRRGGGSGTIGDGGYNKSRGGGRGGGNNSGGGGGDNKEYRPQRRETFSLNHIRPSMQDQQGGGGMRQQHQQQNNRDRDNQQQQHQRGGWGGQRGGNQGGYNNQGGGNQGQGGNRQRGRGGGRSQQGAGNFNRAPGQQLQPGNNAQKNKLKFESDYDFDKANNEFEELRSQIAKVKIGDSDTTPAEAVNGDAAATVTEKKDDSAAGNETGEGGGEHHEEGGEGDANAPIYYDKAKSFFDNISCEAVERSKGRSQRTDWRTERKLNSETFGVASARRGNFRGRGGYYGGGGRGGNQGYHRGGGYNNRNYNNNHNWQRYNNRSLHQPLAAGSGDPA